MVRAFSLARIILFAPDVRSTAAFYNRLFGFPFVGDPNDREFIELDAGGCRLAVHRGAPADAPRAPKAVFRTTDIAAERTRLEKEGLKLTALLDGPGFQFFDVRDPAGNLFQISSRP
jgi:catechol 2,3-dioxygenase-like lactoylglutathione lyase family enzyme